MVAVSTAAAMEAVEMQAAETGAAVGGHVVYVDGVGGAGGGYVVCVDGVGGAGGDGGGNNSGADVSISNRTWQARLHSTPSGCACGDAVQVRQHRR